MLIYNVTCNVEDSILSKWLEWMKEEHIPEVMNIQCFISCKIMRVIQQSEEETGATFAIQYEYLKPENFETYSKEFALTLQQKTKKLFGNSVLAFRTHLEIIHQF
jgi:hypothetical protein